MSQSETVGNSGTALMSKCNVAYLHSDYANSFVKPGAHRPHAGMWMHARFLKIVFVQMPVCVCVSARL